MWVRIAARAYRRAKITVSERHRKPSSERWVVRRNNDGRTWAGPYRWNGNTFTSAERFWFMFASKSSAVAAVEGNGFAGVTVVRIA
jgi:hypothetical protein